MNVQSSLTILRVVLGLVLAGYCIPLVVHQLHARGRHHALLLIAAAELIAALLLLIPRTAKLGGIALIVVFVCAAAFHILHGEYNVAYLAVYAAAALAVVSGERGK